MSMRLFGQVVSARKQFFEGTHRTRSPAETLADYRRFMPVMGITRLANVTGLDRVGLPVCVAVRPNSRSLATSQGKGQTLEAAKASALMEAIESWHGERVQQPVKVASYRELAPTGAAVDPALLPLRADANWSADRPIEWIAGEELSSGRMLWIPFETVTTNFVEWPDRRPVFLKSTNGLASGNHALEAVVHGLLEVIERDALALFSLLPEAQRRVRRISTGSVRNPHLIQVLDRLRDKGIAVLIEDATSDIGVPTYSCTLVDDPTSVHWRAVPKIVGHGAHIQPEVALSRAVHEAIQSRVTVIAGSRDDLFPRDYHDAGGREDHARAVKDATAEGGVFPPSGQPPTERFEDDLSILLERLRQRGIVQVVAVDLSRPGIDVPVVKVVVPGLEPVRTSVWRPGQRARHMMGRELGS
jgi:YcaO-like protein with predicted kinase domain